MLILDLLQIAESLIDPRRGPNPAGGAAWFAEEVLYRFGAVSHGSYSSPVQRIFSIQWISFTLSGILRKTRL